MTKTEEATRIVRSTRDGRLTIPAEFRRALGIDEATELLLTLKDGELRLRPVEANEAPKGSPRLRELYDYFAPGAARGGGEGLHGRADQRVDRRGRARGSC